MRESLPVLIVGAGPTGMMAAASLLEAGVPCRLIDKTPERSDKSRALVVQAKTLEPLQRLGIADGLAARGRTAVQVEWYVGERAPLHIDLGDIAVTDTPYPFLLFVSQVETESALESYLRSRGVMIERPLELVGFTQNKDGVDSRLRRADGREEHFRASYLIGADGAHSAVRKGAGLKFEGAPYQQNFILADTEVEWSGDEGALRLFLSEAGVLVAFPLPGKSRYRIIAAEGTGHAPEGDPSLEEAQALASKLSSIPIRLYDPHWLARFHLHHRGVNHYRVGRTFVAGDAAHIHSPAGGQGMNTGIQDAANLGWKLGLVWNGFAQESLLNSYEEERMPVGKRLLRFTDRLFSLAASRNQWVVRLRDFVLPHLVPIVSASRAGRTKVFRFISELAIDYLDSSIVNPPHATPGNDFEGGPQPGERAPDGPLASPNTTLFQLCQGLRHQLIVFGTPSPEELKALKALRPEWLSVVIVEPSEELRKLYGIVQPSLYLFRPDGYVAFRSAGFSTQLLEAFLGRVYGSH